MFNSKKRKCMVTSVWEQADFIKCVCCFLNDLDLFSLSSVSVFLKLKVEESIFAQVVFTDKIISSRWSRWSQISPKIQNMQVDFPLQAHELPKYNFPMDLSQLYQSNDEKMESMLIYEMKRHEFIQNNNTQRINLFQNCCKLKTLKVIHFDDSVLLAKNLMRSLEVLKISKSEKYPASLLRTQLVLFPESCKSHLLSLECFHKLRKLFIHENFAIDVLPPNLEVLCVSRLNLKPVLPSSLRKIYVSHIFDAYHSEWRILKIPENVRVLQYATTKFEFQAPSNISHLQIFWKNVLENAEHLHLNMFRSLQVLSLDFMACTLEIPNWSDAPNLKRLSLRYFVMTRDVVSEDFPTQMEYLHWEPHPISRKFLDLRNHTGLRFLGLERVYMQNILAPNLQFIFSLDNSVGYALHHPPAHSITILTLEENLQNWMFVFMHKKKEVFEITNDDHSRYKKMIFSQTPFKPFDFNDNQTVYCLKDTTIYLVPLISSDHIKLHQTWQRMMAICRHF